MGDGVTHPLGNNCEGSHMGGFYATILLNGAVSSPQQQVTIVFTQKNDSTKVKQVPYSSTENPYLTGSDTSKITFVVPAVKTIDPSCHFKNYSCYYNISLKLKNQGTISCANANACQIEYDYGRTPLVWQIYNAVSVPGMYHTQRIQLRYANDITKDGLPFRHIAMEGFKCDYTSNDLINSDSSFNRWSTRPYSCVQNFFQPVLKNAAGLQTRTYSGDGFVPYKSVTYLLDGGSFTTRVLPSITSVSAHSGSKEGGHLLEVKGKGWLLEAGKTTLKVDGSVNCVIKTMTKDQSTGEFIANCETQATSATTGSAFVGGQGWLHQIYKGTSSITGVKDASPPKVPDIRTLIFNSQTLFNNIQATSSYVSRSRTFFKAPKTGNYYIWHSGDDSVKVYFSKTPSTIPASWDDSTDLIVNQGYHTGVRSIWGSWDSVNKKFPQKSARIDNLVKDNYYFMEMYHSEGSGDDHATIGFQIQNAADDNPRKLPEVQRIEFRAQPNLDEYKVKLFWGSDHSSAKKFDLKFYNKNKDDEWEVTNITDININSTTSEFQNKVDNYFDKYFSSGKNNFVVVKTMYSDESASTTTTVADDAIIVEFKIHMKVATDTPRQTPGKYPELKSTTIDLTKSQVTFTPGEPGLSGEWQIQIANLNGDIISTGAQISDLENDSSAGSVQSAIWNAVPEYYFKVFVVRRELKNTDPQQSFGGYEYIISFDQYRANVPQINALNVDMKYGENGLKTPTFDQETLQESSNDLFFFPAPYTFFYTPHTKPQMEVTVDSHLGACYQSSETTCDYEFSDEAPQITNIASVSPFTSLTITGTGFGTSADDYSRIEFGGRSCTATVTDTQISCTITNPVAGSHLPTVNSKAKGKVKQTGLTSIDIAPTLTSVSPNSINDQGGQVITLSGTQYPDSTAIGTHTSTVTVGGVACTDIEYVSATSMKCKTGPSIPIGSQDVVLTINGQSVTSSGAVTVTGLGSTTATITPTKMNATEKGTLTVTVSNLAEDLSDKTKFDVKLVSADHTIKMRTFQQSYTVNQNVLKVKYPGGKIGDYTLVVDHADKGTLSDGSQNFSVGAKITAISLLEGSVNGGTEITITGELFHPTQSIIKVGYNDCIVQGSVTTTSLTCITPRTSTVDNTTGDLKTSSADVAIVVNLTEDAKCSVAGGCLFQWKESLTPTVTNTAWSDNTLTITGTGFGTNKANVKVELSELEQQVDTVSDTEIVATVNNLKTRSSKLSLRVVISPKGYALIPKNHSEHDAPGSIIYTALTPATNVSEGGQTLTITGTGFPSDLVAQLKDKDSATKVCDSVKYVSYTELKCQSNKGSMNFSGTTLVIGSTNKSCSSCAIATTGSSPTLTSIADGGYSGNEQTLTLTGTDFPTGGETIVAVKISDTISSSSATINSATSISAVFTGGIGFGTGIKVQSIEFSNGTFAKIDAGATIDQNVIGTAASGLNCSYAGGCLWSYDQANINRLASSMSASVCNLPCVHDSTASTDNSFKCRAPVMATKKSISTYTNLIASKSWQNFNQKDQTEIVSVYSNDPATFGKEAFDNNVSNQTGTGQASCYLGLEIVDANHVGTIDSVRYFFPRTLNADKYAGGKFEVSNDGGTTWSTLFTLQKTPMEGWNGWDRVTAEVTAGASDTFNVVKYTPPTADSSQCNFMEIQIKGKVVRSDTTTTVTCPVVLKRGEQTLATEASGIIYNEANTPKITSLSKKNISANGGQSVIITGTGFNGSITVNIDGIECASPTSGAGGTTVTCTTGKRAAPSVKPFIVSVGTSGYAANQGNKFLYVLNWSDPDAWSGQYGPVDGDSISIPAGQNLVFDIDKGPLLKALIVEGSLLFYPETNKNHKRTFDAEYVFVRGGLLQIGTETEPYDSYLTITMHGTKASVQIPIYGNKVIAVRDGGVLQMHGEAKTPSWTDLYTTANVGGTTMELNIDNTSGTAFNWQVGDVMVLAPTDFDFREAEELTITSITSQNANKRPEITFTPALKYKHYAGRQTFSDGQFIQMRAELGVLTRKVLFQGDSQSQDNQYGAHIMLHSPGDEAVEGRIENIQLTQVGQAFQLGRYPLHFHMIGRVTKSYIKNNAIHHTYNRACTLHGVHYLTIEGNVAYYTMGHTFFIEDAAETKNRLIRNLAIRSEASNSLLNTDQSPAGFWITHPDNIFRDNHAAGAARYGFWFDMQETAVGPSFDANVCPPGQRLGQFNGNVAHSNGRYGLRIFHYHIPRTHPCKPVSITPPEGSTNPENDAFAQNPPIVAVYQNFTGYKNNRNAVITEKIGAVQFKNIKTADNLFAGVETTLPGFAKLDQGFLDGALIIGFSQNAGDFSRYEHTKGIIAGQRDIYIFKNVKFHDFDSNSASTQNAAISTCSHCAHVLDEEGFANTSSFQGLTFNSVSKKLLFTQHQDAIIHDIDGSLSGAGGERWLTPNKPHHQISGVCTQDANLDTAAVCTSPVRKLLFKNPVKSNQLKGQKMKITLAANVPTPPQGSDDVTWTSELHNKYSQISMNDKKTQWEIPFVIGQNYNVHWQYGIDWEGFKVYRSRLFKATDPGFALQFNYTDRRDEFHVQARAKVENITTQSAVLDYSTASNTATQTFGAHINNIPNKLWSVLVNSKPDDGGLGGDRAITVSTVRCTGGCSSFAKVNVEQRVRKWSVPADWEDTGDTPGSGKVPVAGDQVIIKGNWNMQYDIESTNAVKLKKLFINGRLTFSDPDSADKHFELKSEWVIVDTGELLIGSETVPYRNKATITLLGTPNQKSYAYSNDVKAGNKILFVSGKLYVNVKDILSGGSTQSKLLLKGNKGSKSLKVDAGLNWMPGHKIAIAPSGYDYKQHELKEIETYDNATGDLTVKTALLYEHYGAAASETYQTYSYDLRTEVGHLTRNVVIQGEENQRWGGQILVTEFTNSTSQVIFAGTATLKNVQIVRMSQYDTQSAAFRTSRVQQRPIIVDRCSFHQTPAWAFNIGKSKNITITNNVIYETHRNAIKVHGADTFKMMNNLFIFNDEREFDDLMVKDHQVAVDLCTGQNTNTCTNMLVQNNVIAGGKGIGFLIPSMNCEDEAGSEQWFKNNKVHSTQVGMIPAINSAVTGTCGLLKNFEAHHNYKIAITSLFSFTKLVLKNIVLVDNAIGVKLGLGRDSNIEGQILFENSLVIGEHTASKNCQVSYESSGIRKIGIFSSIGGAIHSVPFTYPKLGFFMVSVNPGRGKYTTIKNVVFKDFPDPSTRCKANAATSVMHTHQEGSDLIMAHIFRNVKFDGVAKKGFVFLMDPPLGWANPTDCVDFPCTAPQNLLLQFRDGVTDTSAGLGLPAVPFDIVANNPGIKNSLGTCSFISDWNSSLCQGDIRALLQFESLDSDKMDRSVVPIYVTNKSIPNFNNKLNSYMDHVWDGFYTGQKRFSRFISVVRTDSLDFTEIAFTGTPPLSQLYQLYNAKSKTQYLKIKIDYPKPEAVRVKLGSVELGQQELQNGVPAALTGTNCGENRWTPQQNILEFTLLADPTTCSLTLITKQSIQVTFRIQMTIAEFYNNNHSTTFVNRLSASLGIATHRIRVVGVTAGSVVVHSQITQDDTNSSEAGQISEINSVSQKLNSIASSGAALGDWKVLDFSMEVRTHQGGRIAEDPATPTSKEESDGLSIGIIVLIVVGSVIFVTVIVLVIVIVLHRKKPKVMFTTVGKGKGVAVDDELFKKRVDAIPTDNLGPTNSSKKIDNSYNDMNPNSSPVVTDRDRVEDID